MTTIDSPKILFVINPKSGSSTTNWALAIIDYFKPLNFVIELLVLSTTCSSQIIITKINSFFPQIVVAVGGDGTVKLVAECLLQTNILLGILPAGSANGLAKELGINNNLTQALDVIIKGYSKKKFFKSFTSFYPLIIGIKGIASGFLQVRHSDKNEFLF